ncbi:MAG: helix-turn-helix domain-containing protein [Christensenellales bacterium]
MRFSSLVNRYRVEEAAKLIATENVSATEAAMRSGFNSIRSFNRVFRSMSGRTPTGR